MAIRRVNSKMKKEKVMKRSKQLRPHLPETKRYKPGTLEKMMQKHDVVLVKPDRGRKGDGIVRVRRVGVSQYEVCSVNLKCQTTDRASLAEIMQSYMKSGKRYLIQQGIDLARYEDRLYDLRMVLQKPDKKWLVSGIVARVGAPNEFVTNYHKGGKAVTIEEALEYTRNKGQKAPSKRKILKLARRLADVLDSNFPGIRELGIDLGIDQQGHLWIFEANTHPAYYLFKQIDDKSMHKTIRTTRRQIRREYA